MKGIRADVRLVELGLAESREKARALIMSGVVLLAEKRIEKPGENVAVDAMLTLKENPLPFVSRGGLKLEKAVTTYNLDLSEKVAIDIGASTGGFTDCMLSHGAKKVYAIDVGYGQIDYKLRTDERVVVMDRTNARYMEPGWFEEKADFASADVSFISIKLILPVLYPCLSDNAQAVVLVKPQFEAGRENVGKNGVVRDPLVHNSVLLNVALFANECSFCIQHIDYSPIRGPKGNIEYLLVLQKIPEEAEKNVDEDKLKERVKDVVERAHKNLNNA